MNIACSHSGCTNPVVVQCAGYERNCGRFCCRLHSSDNLCHECVIRKEEDEIYHHYLQTAKDIDKTVKRRGCVSFIGVFLLSAIIYGAGPIVYDWFTGQPPPSIGRFRASDPLVHFVAGVTFFFLLFASSILITLRRKKLIRKTSRTLPRFDEFYREHQKIQGREALKIAGALAVNAVAESIYVSLGGEAGSLQERMILNELTAIRKNLDSR